jgi:mannose-6-phosphate isomerase-like protein (cupin superfamily)
MSIPKGESTGIEMHNGMDQFIKVESGICDVIMGISPEKMDKKERIDSRYAVLIPAGTYHNIINAGAYPVKLFSLYSPKNHPFGTVDETKSDADERERKEDEKRKTSNEALTVYHKAEG